jgi:hypothetical protein
MNIEWNKVTWYSKLLAVVLFVGVFVLAFYLGKETAGLVEPEVVLQPQLTKHNNPTEDKDKEYILGYNTSSDLIEIWETGLETSRLPLLDVPKNHHIASQGFYKDESKLFFTIASGFSYKHKTKVNYEPMVFFRSAITYMYDKNTQLLEKLFSNTDLGEGDVCPLIGKDTSPEGKLIAFNLFNCSALEGDQYSGVETLIYNLVTKEWKIIEQNMNFKFIDETSYQYNDLIITDCPQEIMDCREPGQLHIEKF